MPSMLNRASVRSCHRDSIAVAMMSRFIHDEETGTDYVPVKLTVIDPNPCDWSGRPVKYGHYVKVRDELSGREFGVKPSNLCRWVDVVEHHDLEVGECVRILQQHAARHAEEEAKRFEELVNHNRDVVFVADMLESMGHEVQLLDFDSDSKAVWDLALSKPESFGKMAFQPTYLGLRGGFFDCVEALMLAGLLDPTELHSWKE